MLKNPFVVYGYISPEFFCNREKELNRLISAIENNRNVTLQSPRRIGKTSLLHHLVYHLKKKKTYRALLIDLQFTSKLSELLDLLANSVYQNLFPAHRKLAKEFLGIFRAVKPALTVDSKTGSPALELGIRTEQQALISISDIFDYVKEYSNKFTIVIALDEFQQIVSYPEKNIEAFLRSKVQELPKVRFIFSGSSTHLMTEMFFSAKRPFFQSTEMLYLEKIPGSDFSSFIKDKFSGAGIEISQDSIVHLLSLCFGYTYYVQFLCNRLFTLGLRKIDNNVIDNTLTEILNENESTYYSYKKLLTDYQWKLTGAIAREKFVDSPTGSKFISKFGLGAVSSVRTALKSLLEKEIIYRENDSYFVYDIFFGKWLENS